MNRNPSNLGANSSPLEVERSRSSDKTISCKINTAHTCKKTEQNQKERKKKLGVLGKPEAKKIFKEILNLEEFQETHETHQFP